MKNVTPVRTAPVLVTGATGFLGRHLFEALAKSGSRTRALALVRDESDWTRQDWTSPLRNVEPLEGRVTGDDRWLSGDERLGELSGIFHLAAVVRHSRRDTGDVYETNVEGTLRMVRLAAEKRCRMVFVSTSGTVACSKTPFEMPDEDAPYAESAVSSWPYYDSKIKAERAARALAAELGVELVIVRPPIMLGPGDHRFRSTSNVVRFLRRRLPFLVKGGIAFTDVRDAAAAILAAMAHPLARPVYHLEGTSCSVEQFFRMCEEVSGVPAPKRFLPQPVAWALANASEQAAFRLKTHPVLPDPVVVEMASRWWGVRSRYAASELGYAYRPPRQTLVDTIEWLRGNHPQLKKENAGRALA